MKILIASAVYYPQINGVAVFSHNLAVGLARRGHSVVVVCPSQKGRSYKRTIDGVETHYLHSVEAKVYPDQIHSAEERQGLLYKHGFRVSMFPARAVRKIMDKFKPDVVHVQVSDPIGLSCVTQARRKGIPVVTTEHNQPEVITEPLGVPEFVKKPVDALLAAYFVNRQSKSDFVTMPTEKSIRNLIYNKGREFNVPVAAVSNGVDLSSFKPGRADEKLYKTYKLNASYKTVLYLGRVDPEKNVGAVIEAFLKAENDGLLDSQLVIVGDGVDRRRLEKRFRGHKNIHFLGRITGERLCEIYRLGDVFATASEIETQGIVLIEAAASGLPLIAVDAGAVSEVCQDGVNGFLCTPGNINEIAAAISKILTEPDLRNEFSKNSVKIAKEHDFEKTLDKYINIYERVVSNATSNTDSKAGSDTMQP